MLRYDKIYSLSELMRVCEDLNFPYFSKENIRLFQTKASDFVPTLIEIQEESFDQYGELILGYYVELVKASTLNPEKYYQIKKVTLSKNGTKYDIWFSTICQKFNTKRAAMNAAKNLKNDES